MRSDQYDVVIVGSGLAGIGAASELAGQKCRVLLLDENGHMGGQLLREQEGSTGGRCSRRGAPLPKGEIRRFKERVSGLFSDPVKEEGHLLMDALRRPNIKVMPRARLLGIYPERTLCIEDARGGIFTLTPRHIILAVGARERFIPFKGWTLPGVVSLGSAQLLMKGSGVLPGHRTVVAGAGPLIFSLGGEILRNGGQVAAVLDRGGPGEKLDFFRQRPPQWSRMKEGARNTAILLSRGIRVRQRRMVVEALGDGKVEEIITAATDTSGKRVPGSEKRFYGDCLAVGHGFVPNLELAAAAGVDLKYDGDLGGWIVSVDDAMATSCKGIYAAGEITGIAGGCKSLVEGRLAALSILRERNEAWGRSMERRAGELRQKRRAEQRFGAFLASLSRVPEATFQELDDSIVICRCEDITLGEIRRMVAMGFHTTGLLKKASRTGMGNCQGRTCGPMIADILSHLTGVSPERIPPMGARPPVKGVRLDALAAMGTL